MRILTDRVKSHNNLLKLFVRNGLLLLVSLALLSSLPGSLLSQEKAKKPATRKSRGMIEMNFKNVDMINFLAIMSETLKIPMIWDEAQIKGSITLVSPKKFNKRDTLRIFETVLSHNNLTTIKSVGSPLLQVVPIRDAPRFPSPTLKPGGKGGGQSFFVTQIIPLQHAIANQIKAALTPLISKTAGIAIYTPANVMVVSDTETNVKRLVSIIKQMDIPPDDVNFELVTLNYASSSKMAALLTTLSASIGGATAPGRAAQPGRPPTPGRGGSKSGFKAVSDDRTNSLILVGSPFTLERFRKIIEVLDTPGSVQESGVKVYRLDHADAEELVKILKNVNVRTPTKSTPGVRKPIQRGPASPLPSLTITADKATNSLLVFGDKELMETMEAMIRELDVRRPQVYVEVLIMEMTLEKSLQLGVRWQAANTTDNGIVGAGVPDGTPKTMEGALADGSGSVLGIIGNQITFGGQKFASFSGFIKANQQDQDLNVLANPQILTLNNQEAEINVSQVVPVSTRTVTNAQSQTTTEFEFKDVGIILKITPQITGGDKVRLLIKQESSSIAAKQTIANSNQQAITTLKRSINTQVVVDNNATMAIGGLIQDTRVNTETKVPCLGDIPLLGWFFKSGSNELRKINLVVFIRPRIISSPEDLKASTRRVQQRYERSRYEDSNTDSILRKSFGLDPKLTEDILEEHAEMSEEAEEKWLEDEEKRVKAEREAREEAAQ